MGGVDDQDRMEFKTDRAWLDVPHSGQQQRGEHLSIREPAMDSRRDLFQEPLTRCLFKQPNQRLHLRTESHYRRVELRFSGGHSRQF